MESKDKKRFGEMMGLMAITFDKQISKPLLDVYFKILQKYTIGKVEIAINKAMEQLRWFPKPAELIELGSGGPGKLEDIAQVQADIVIGAIHKNGAYRSMIFTDPVTTAVIQNCFGGWIKMCSELNEDEVKWLRKDFVKYYQAYTRQNIESNDKLVGIHEAENMMKGFLEFIPNPVQIGDRQTLKEIEYKNKKSAVRL